VVDAGEARKGTVIRTVLGDVAPETLGFTLPHEHLLVDIRPPALRGEARPEISITLENRYRTDYGRAPQAGNYLLDDEDLMAAELRHYSVAGGDALVELTVGGLAPKPDGLARLAAATGVKIVMGCGHYVEDFLSPALNERSVDDFASEMVGQICDGAWGTAVRAGIIGEIGCSVPWTPLERRIMRAAVLAQQDTGASLTIHPGAAPHQPDEIVAFLKQAGADLQRTIISHIDRTLFDIDAMKRLAQTGVVLEFDLFGYETAYWPLGDIDMPNDGQRITYVRQLVEAGHGDQVLCSQDICRLTRLTAHGGHGYAHMRYNVLPIMRRRGLGDATIEQIFVHTPRRLLAFRPG
jgi:phosphotriesterase-related protein